MNVFEQLGPLALATRLKLLSERLAKDVANIYRQLNIPFEPRWFTLFWVLKHKPALTITELAQELQQTHAAAVQLSNLLEKKGLVISSKDKNDERRRQVSLTDKGLRLFEEVVPVLNAIEQANADLLLLTAPDFLENLKATELALDHKSMHDRILESMQLAHQGVRVKGYTAAYKDSFKKIEQEWLQERFKNSAESNKTALENPEEILARGGMVFLALYGQEVVGTAAVRKSTAAEFSITHFMIGKHMHGKGVDKALYKQCRSYASAKEAGSLQVYVHLLITDMINFFISQGFLVAPQEAEALNVHTLKMRLALQP